MSVNFSFVEDDDSRYYIQDAYNAVSSVEGGWEFLKTFVPAENEGYMFSRHPMLLKIIAKMDDGHSGASYAWTIRQMDYIAKHGMNKFKGRWVM